MTSNFLLSGHGGGLSLPGQHTHSGHCSASHQMDLSFAAVKGTANSIITHHNLPSLNHKTWGGGRKPGKKSMLNYRDLTAP